MTASINAADDFLAAQSPPMRPVNGRFRVVVIDERQVLGDCVIALRQEGYDVMTCDAAQGQEVLEVLDRPSSDVVTVNVVHSAPQSLALLRAGLQLCERLKSHSERRAVGFLLAQGNRRPARVRQILNDGQLGAS